MSDSQSLSDFPQALAFVLEREGGFSDDPNDPGGATNFGITQSTYDTWRNRQGLTPFNSVEGIAPEEVESIYQDGYWDGSQPWPLSLVLFDTRVQHGRWALIVQRAINAQGGDEEGSPVAEDGSWGPKTANAVRWRVGGAPGALALSVAIIAERLAYYTELGNWEHAGKGWARRMAELLRAAQGEV